MTAAPKRNWKGETARHRTKREKQHHQVKQHHPEGKDPRKCQRQRQRQGPKTQSNRAQNTNSRRNNPRTNNPRGLVFGLPDFFDFQIWLVPKTTQRPINETVVWLVLGLFLLLLVFCCVGLWALAFSLSLTLAMVTLSLGSVAWCCFDPTSSFGVVLFSPSHLWVLVLLSLPIPLRAVLPWRCWCGAAFPLCVGPATCCCSLSFFWVLLAFFLSLVLFALLLLLVKNGFPQNICCG